MPTWIVTHSEFLCNFLTPLLVGFSPAQLRHALNFIEAVLVCTARHKTLARLTRWLRVAHADEYAWADFFRVSPWSGEAVRTAVLGFLLRTVAAIQVKTGWRWLFLSVDDSLCCKDVATHKLAAVSLHFDHVRQRSQSTTPRARLAAAPVSVAAEPGAADVGRDRAAERRERTASRFSSASCACARAATAAPVQSLCAVRCLVCRTSLIQGHSRPRLALALRCQSQSPLGRFSACPVVATFGPPAHRARNPVLDQRPSNILDALSFDAILHWHALVFAAYAFIQSQRVKPLLDDPKATLPPLGEVLADHQRWHGRQMILDIARRVRQGMSNAELLAELMP